MTLNLISISIQYIMNCSTAKGSISNAKEQCISPALEEGGGLQPIGEWGYGPFREQNVLEIFKNMTFRIELNNDLQSTGRSIT